MTGYKGYWKDSLHHYSFEDEYEPDHEYTNSELEFLGDLLLFEDRHNSGSHHDILTETELKNRRRREILNISGTVDPSVNQGMYWRPHRDGRKVNSPEKRKKFGAPYYAY